MGSANAGPDIKPDLAALDSSVNPALEVALGPEPEDARDSTWREKMLNYGRAAVISAEVTPANEAIRLAAFGAAQAISGDPAIGALAYGGSTLAIESAAGVATAGALETGTARKAINKVNSLLERVGISADAETSGVTKAAAALVGGTAISMSLKHRENPDRTQEENRKYGFRSAAGLAGVCAVQGYFMSKGISAPAPETIGAGVGALAGVRYAAKRVINRGKEKFAKENLEDYIPDHDLKIGLTVKKKEIKQALKLEQKIWDENDFGSLDDYKVYNKQSRVFAAFKGKKCVGITRLFAGGPELPPFAKEMPITDEADRKQIVEDCANGDMEELGTTAVDHELSGAPKNLISTDMWRLAYRDARQRGIKKWGIIMEPERVQKMNDNFGFTFQQLGPAVEYQGGDCAGFVMDLEEVDQQMSKNLPDLYDWFVNQPLNPAKN